MEEKTKNTKALIIAVIVVVVIVGLIMFVRKQSAKNQSEEYIKDVMSTITQTQDKVVQSTITDTTESKQESTQKQYAQVTVGQTITIDDYLEYSFVETRFTNRIDPTTPASYYHYYEAKSADSTLIAVKTKIKNLEPEEFNGENIPTATIVYNDKYKYDCNIIVEEDDGSDLSGYDWYMNIDPLKSKTFYYYVEIPQEVETDNNSLVLRIELKGNAYELKIK